MRYNLTPEVIEQLQELCDDADLGNDVHALRTDYSGRSMHGATCLALVSSVGDLVRFLLDLSHAASLYDPDSDTEAAQLRLRELIDAMRSSGTRYDSMGRSTIYYWPSISAD